jgi:uncharacterized protein with beta-barrel porin domain
MGMMVFEVGDRAVRSSTPSRAASASPLGSPKTPPPRSGGALGRLRARLLGGASSLVLPAAALALGVSFATEARAQKTFTGTYLSTINLANYPGGNPFTFANTSSVNTAGDAVDGNNTVQWTLTNNGTLTGANGIALQSQSTVTNAGAITGTGNTPGFVAGVLLNAGGSVTNQTRGVISAGVYGVYVKGAAGTVTNAGAITGLNVGVYLAAGGSVTNQAGGTIGNRYSDGVRVYGGAGTVTNAGTITGGTFLVLPSNGVDLMLGGSVTNQAGGAISGLTNGVFVNNTNGTVINAGSITGTFRYGVNLQAGGSVTNQAGGTISGGNGGVYVTGGVGTVTNAGTITGTTNYGVFFRSGGNVTNQAGGVITGLFDGVASGGPGTVINYGSITGTNRFGVFFASGGSVTNQAGGVISSSGTGVYLNGGAGTVTNFGTITGGTGRYGVFLHAGGSVANQAGGTISGGTGVYVSGAAGTVTNAGRITGTGFAGVSLIPGGSVTNQAGGTISGGNVGIYDLAGTVTNAGTIAGGTYSVEFRGVGAHTLILQTGSVLNGTAFGSTSGGATNALILQGTGTANNNFVNFTTLDVQASGTWTLDGTAALSSTALVESGVLSVTGNLSSAATLTVNSGATLAGTGTVTTTSGIFINNGGAVQGGVPGATGTLSVGGNLTFNAGGMLSTIVTSAAASLVSVGGSAALSGGVVQVTSPANSFRFNSPYTILTSAGLGGSRFSALATPSGTTGSLSYPGNNVQLTLTSALGQLNGLNTNQRAVGTALDGAFNAGGTSGALGGIFGGNIAQNLTQVSGETATGSQQTTFDAMTQFLGVLTDPFIGGRGEGATGGTGATPFAEEFDSVSGYAADAKKRPRSERDAYAMFTKAPPAPFDPRWSVWAAGFGGSQTTTGNPTLGSNDTASRLGAVAVGADYRFSPDTIAGFALAGGGTNFSVANGGSGRSDLFQAGAFVRHTVGPAYISAALAYGWQDITTDRTVTVAGIDQLRAEFNANAFSGRVEGGYRFVSPWIGGIGITPYAAGQFTTFDLPAYAERAIVGSNQFALGFAAKSVTDTRSEFGVRTDKSFAMQSVILTLRGRLAWAHDFNPDRSIGATFQSLPGASFVVNGAGQASDSALTTASAELKWQNGWSAAATFEGEFSDVTRSYAGKGVVRYTW